MIGEDWSGRTPLDLGEIVVRYVGGSNVDQGVVNGGAFDRRETDVDGLSLTRRGVFANDTAKDRTAIREAVGGRLTFGKTALFAELTVRSIETALADFGEPIMVCADPLDGSDGKPANVAHALLLGLPFAGQSIGSLQSELAGDRLRRCIASSFPAIELAD